MDVSPSGSYLGRLAANRWSGHGCRVEMRGRLLIRAFSPESVRKSKYRVTFRQIRLWFR